MANIAKICSQQSYIVPGTIRITEYFFEVPRDWTRPNTYAKQTISLFARAARRVEKPADSSSADEQNVISNGKTLSWLLFLQGGPGYGCTSPENSPWTNTMLDRGYQILCLDYRGTGLSSPLTSSTLGLRGDDAVQAQYLKSFRSDSIVKDCEAVRRALMKDLPEEKQKWTLMGQSFGGFCIFTYLSFAPGGVREAFVFGGIPPFVDGPDQVYERLYRRVVRRNEIYYDKYPDDIDRVKQICKFLQRFGDTTVRDMSQEGHLTARRFMQLGLHFGFHGGIDTVHDCVLRAHNDLNLFGHITRPTVAKITGLCAFDEAIIYSVLHEPIYCRGKAPNWSAERLKSAASPYFTIPTPAETKSNGPIYFTGEMIYPWMFEDYGELKRLAPVADLVQRFDDWSPLYDKAQLAKNTIPVYAAVYMDDMYVDFDLAMQTVSKVQGCKVCVTNAMYHDAVRTKLDEISKAIFALRDDVID